MTTTIESARESNPASAFVPVAIGARYSAPRASVHPDQSKSWIRRLIPIVSAHRWTVAAGLISSTIMLLLALASPRIIMEAIDVALVARRESLTPYVWALIGVAAAAFVFGFFFRYLMTRTGLDIEYDLRNILYEHMSRQSFSFYDSAQSGQLISRANSDIRAIQMFLTFAPALSISIATFLAAFGLMLSIDWKLSLVAILALPGTYTVGRKMRNRIFPISWLVQARMADVATIVEENVTGVRVVKSFAAEEQQIRLLDRAARRLRWASILQVDVRAKFAPLMQNLPRVGLAAVLLYGGWLAIHDQVTIGALVLFNAYVLMLQMPFMMLGFIVMMAQRAAASSARIFEVLDQQPAIKDRLGAVDLVDCRGEVEFRKVTFGYGSGPAMLENFSLRLQPGGTLAMVGRTGCGKSTAARLIPRFYDVKEGAVLIDGVDVRDLTVTSLRHHIGLVLDEPFLFSESIRDNIAYGRPDAGLKEVVDAATAAGAHEFITELRNGYDTVIGERGYTLSGGQRQRIAIARELLVNPRILILDDATSSIDVQLEQEIHQALKTLMRGRTTLIIAHRLSTISLAERVVLVDDGHVVADGTHAELMRQVPAYAEVLARAEEEWQAAHTPAPEVGEESPQRLRVIRELEAAEEQGMNAMPGIDPLMPGEGRT